MAEDKVTRARKPGYSRRDRVFKVHLDLSPLCGEDRMMDYIEDAVSNYYKFNRRWQRIPLDTESVCVRRASPKLGEKP